MALHTDLISHTKHVRARQENKLTPHPKKSNETRKPELKKLRGRIAETNTICTGNKWIPIHRTYRP